LRSVVAIACASVGVLWALSAASVTASRAATSGAPTIAWGSCSDPALRGLLGVQCGYLSVPLDYGNPGGQQIQLAVSRLVHTSGHYQGVILTNPGGPGQSGLGTSANLALALVGEGFLATASEYDWIGFDPRGVGASKPAISCLPNYFRADRPDYVPRTHALLNYWLGQSKAYAQACESKSPLQAALLAHMTTADLARDMESIRTALSQRQITYYGFSYGTYLGQVYATLFPSRVRRLILDSNIDPHSVWYQANLRQDHAFNRNENIWFSWLARYHSVYRLGRTKSSVKKLFYASESRLRTHPAGGQIGPDEWVDLFLGAGYEQQSWPALAQAFADWVHRHSRRAAAELVSHYRSQDSPGNDNSFAAYLAVQCTDAAWPTSWRVWNRDVSAINAVAPFIAWSNTWFNAPCIYWPAPAGMPVPVDGTAIGSALLIDETLDAATPFPGSLVVRALFPHSVLLAEPGGTSHADSLNGNLCVDRTIAQYLATGALPPRKPHARWDKTCTPLPSPVPGGRAHSARTAGRAIVRPPGRFGTAATVAG
jgi:pimeloyl-ACP methyl ester carboxylesterase